MDWNRCPLSSESAAISYPSETITFGEKKSGSYHVHMDFYQGKGNDIEEIEQARHGARGDASGGSNYALTDGSARYLQYSRSVKPVNLWAVTEEWRNATVKLGE